jgi:hypothetical protein
MLLFVDINSFKMLRIFLAFFTTIIPFPYLLTYLQQDYLSNLVLLVQQIYENENPKNSDSARFLTIYLCLHFFYIKVLFFFLIFISRFLCGFSSSIFLTLIVKLLIVVFVCGRQCYGYLIYICLKFRSLSA